MGGASLEIPLFPLHVVLFPGMALPLHIFEARYRRMTSDCLDSNLPIGVVLAMPGSAHGHEVSAGVGTFARIADYERLPDGRYNLLTVGTQRFRVLEEQREGHIYLTGRVEPLDDMPEDDSGELAHLTVEAHKALKTYLHTVLELLGNEDYGIEVPEDATDLSYLIATCLGCDDDQKQKLLETTSVSERLVTGIAGLRHEIAALEQTNEGDEGHEGHSSDDRSHLN